MIPKMDRKWSPTANDPQTANDHQNGPQMIPDRKWSPKWTTNDPPEMDGMEWIFLTEQNEWKSAKGNWHFFFLPIKLT